MCPPFTVFSSTNRLNSLTQSHTGVYLAEKVAECLKDFGLATRILGTVMDNASNNDAMLKEIPSFLPVAATVGTDYQIRCFAHILNLVVKAFLSTFDRKKSKGTGAQTEEGDGVEEEEEGEDDDDKDDEEEDELDDDDVVENAEADRNAGDDAEVEEFAEVEMTEEERAVGVTTIWKVCANLTLVLHTNSLLL